MRYITVRHLLTFIFSSLSLTLYAADEFDFDISSYEKKNYTFSGYIELLADRQFLNPAAAAYILNSSTFSNHDTLNQQLATLELTGDYSWTDWQLAFNVHSNAEHDSIQSQEHSQLYEAYVAYKPEPGFTFELGKRALKWGKAYAWNPVAFAERPKNPDEPDLSREGYTIAGMDIIKSYSGDLRTLAITPVYLPVTENLNEDYGKPEHNNIALKLYALYKDTDLDLFYLGEGSRSYRYGLDFAHNITSNFEVHGEWAYISELSKQLIDNAGNVSTNQISANQWVLGLRYLTENETTVIAEYYRNQAGYTEQQMADFFSAVHNAANSGNKILLDQLSTLSQQTYLRRNPGRQYLYLRLTNKEPFDWLYFTPALTLISNLEDNSYSITPELAYTGFQDLELRLKASWLDGKANSEFGEKRNDQKIEFRLRYFF